MTHAKPVATPMSSSHALTLCDSDAFHDPTLYRSTVGGLKYVMLTRLDLSFVVNRVCQYMHRPTVNHWTIVKRILCYLKATFMHGLHISPTSSNLLQAYFDVDWVGLGS